MTKLGFKVACLISQTLYECSCACWRTMTKIDRKETTRGQMAVVADHRAAAKATAALDRPEQRATILTEEDRKDQRALTAAKDQHVPKRVKHILKVLRQLRPPLPTFNLHKQGQIFFEALAMS